MPADPKQQKVIDMLVQAYWMELETVINYTTNSVMPDGVRAEEIKKSLAADVAEELLHAQTFAKRIKTLYGKVPGSMAFKPCQELLQPPADSTDIVSVIKGVIDAETGAIKHYTALIKASEAADDYVTADILTGILADEQEHRRQFEGFLKEYVKA